MKILIIRHGDPDYANDTLTPKGWNEAACLAERMAQIDVKDFYVSPLGRAQDTASLTLKRMDRTAETLDWLREFDPRIIRDGEQEPSYAWDWQPQAWMDHPIFFDPDHWYEEEAMRQGHVKERYEWVTRSFDQLLLDHGYRRSGRWYEAVRPNHDTLVLFCHFGAACVLLSRLLNISPMVLWHGIALAPASVTVVSSEERKEGTAVFRALQIGDQSHLYACHEKPSFSARFCECCTDKTRH